MCFLVKWIMKIEVKENNDLVEFGSLKCGDVFEDEEMLCIKSEEIIDRRDDNEYNSLDLIEGYLHFFSGRDMVKPHPNAKLVLED